MSDESAPSGAAVLDGQPPAPVQAPVAATPATEAEPPWLKGRLEQARTSAQKDFLKSIGVDKPEDVTAALAKLKTLEDEKLSEAEKTTRRLGELEPKAARAGELEAAVKLYADRELSGLSDLQRAAVASLAGEDPAKVLKAIESLKPTWVVEAPKPAAAPVPASTSAASPAPAAAGSTSQTDHKAEYSRLVKENPFAAHAYYVEHARQIL
jgi:hypothetical protein